MDYYDRAGLTPYLDKLGFELVGFGCTTCIGNSGPLLPGVSDAVAERRPGRRRRAFGQPQFRGPDQPRRPHELPGIAAPGRGVRHRRFDGLRHRRRAAGTGADGEPVYLRDIWPTSEEVAAVINEAIAADMFEKSYAEVFAGRRALGGAARCPKASATSGGRRRPTSANPLISTVCRTSRPPLTDIHGARALAKLGDSVTTDHISPAGNIRKDGPAGSWLDRPRRGPRRLQLLRVAPGQPRGNGAGDIRQCPAPQPAGARAPRVGSPRSSPPASRPPSTTPPCATQAEGTPLVVLAGKEYGSGSSRDWAAKGTALLGVRAVLAESFERIHRSNLVGMGILPLQFLPGESAETLGLAGEEVFDITGLEGGRPSAARCRKVDGQRRRQGLRGGAPDRHPGRGRVLPPRRHPALRAASVTPACLIGKSVQAGRRGPDGALYPFTAPEVRPDTTALRKTSTRMAMGTTATTLAANSVPYGTVNWEPNSAIPTGMVR